MKAAGPNRILDASAHTPVLPFIPICGLLFMTAACGYHVAGRGERIPADVRTIAIPIFTNDSSRYKIEQRLTRAVTREFIERTKFGVTQNPTEADAVLHGTVKDVRAAVLTFDLTTGRATSLQVQVTVAVDLTDLHGKKVIFSNSNYIFREQYQISLSPNELFQEDEPALERLSRDFAQTLVTDVLENF